MSVKSYKKLRADINSGTIDNVYIFWGKQAFLREESISSLKKALVTAGTEAFNYHVFEAENLDLEELESAMDTVPMMSERSMIVVNDLDLFRSSEPARNKLTEIISQAPDYCCLIFNYDTIGDYKADKRMKKLGEAIENNVSVVEFGEIDEKAMYSWVRRRFIAGGKDIDMEQTEYFLFKCGNDMTNLVNEIEKVAAFAEGDIITRHDIDEAALPVLDAVVFDMTDAVVKKDFDKGMKILSELLAMHEEPIAIIAALGGQFRRLYGAKLALNAGRDARGFAKEMGFRSEYPAKLLMQSAKKLTTQWCRSGIRFCAEADIKAKSTVADDELLLQMLMLQLSCM